VGDIQGFSVGRSLPVGMRIRVSRSMPGLVFVRASAKAMHSEMCVGPVGASLGERCASRSMQPPYRLHTLQMADKIGAAVSVHLRAPPAVPYFRSYRPALVVVLAFGCRGRTRGARPAHITIAA